MSAQLPVCQARYSIVASSKACPRSGVQPHSFIASLLEVRIYGGAGILSQPVCLLAKQVLALHHQHFTAQGPCAEQPVCQRLLHVTTCAKTQEVCPLLQLHRRVHGP